MRMFGVRYVLPCLTAVESEARPPFGSLWLFKVKMARRLSRDIRWREKSYLFSKIELFKGWKSFLNVTPISEVYVGDVSVS